MNLTNNTISSYEVFFDLQNATAGCSPNWCKDQHYTFQHNEIIYTLFLPCIIFFFFCAYRFIDTDKKHAHFLKGEHGEHNRLVIKKALAITIRTFFYIFFGYLIYLVKWGALSAP